MLRRQDCRKKEELIPGKWVKISQHCNVVIVFYLAFQTNPRREENTFQLLNLKTKSQGKNFSGFFLNCSNTFFLNRSFALKKWPQMRTRSIIRTVQDIYNFFLNSNINDLFPQIYNAIISNQNSGFKINYSFGYILRNIETGVLCFFHPSFSNHCVLSTAI